MVFIFIFYIIVIRYPGQQATSRDYRKKLDNCTPLDACDGHCLLLVSGGTELP